jgi:glycerol-3-phosphate acyltransferase PlsX
MGLNGICIKSHGGTDAFGFANAIGVAVDMVQNGAIENMKRDFDQMMTIPGAVTGSAAL